MNGTATTGTKVERPQILTFSQRADTALNLAANRGLPMPHTVSLQSLLGDPVSLHFATLDDLSALALAYGAVVDDSTIYEGSVHYRSIVVIGGNPVRLVAVAKRQVAA